MKYTHRNKRTRELAYGEAVDDIRGISAMVFTPSTPEGRIMTLEQWESDYEPIDLASRLDMCIRENAWDEIFELIVNIPDYSLLKGQYNVAKQYLHAGGRYSDYDAALARIRMAVAEYIKKLKENKL